MKAALAVVDKVRAGAAVPTAELGDALDVLDAQPWSTKVFEAKRTLLLALFGGSSREGMLRALAAELPMRISGAEIRGVLLDEGDPLSAPLPANPWGIRRHHTLVDAIDHVWDLFDAPRLTGALLERVVALVLLEHAGAPLLGYVRYHERDSYDIPKAFAKKRKPPFDRRTALAWEPFGDLSMFAGAAPTTAKTTKRRWRIAEPLRALYRVHAGLGDGMWSLAGPTELMPWSEMLGHDSPQVVAAEDADEQIRSDQLLYLFGYGDDRSDLLDIRDRDEPVVRAWGDGHLYAGAGEPIGEWLEGLTPLIVKIAQE